MMSALYRYRDWIATPIALVVLGLMIGIPTQQAMKQLAPSKVMEVGLDEPPPPPPPVVEPPKPAPQPVRPDPTPPKPVAEPPRPVAPRTETPVESPTPVPTPQPQPTPQPVATPTPPEPPRETPPVKASPPVNVEQSYTSKLLAYVEGRKKYPTGREASIQKPTGSVKAELELDRSGVVKGVKIVGSSNSMILDAEAKKLLNLGTYPPFPADAFAGETTHRFTITLEYSLQSS